MCEWVGRLNVLNQVTAYTHMIVQDIYAHTHTRTHTVINLITFDGHTRVVFEREQQVKMVLYMKTPTINMFIRRWMRIWCVRRYGWMRSICLDTHTQSHCVAQRLDKRIHWMSIGLFKFFNWIGAELRMMGTDEQQHANKQLAHKMISSADGLEIAENLLWQLFLQNGKM